jgi:hypothetical protein
MTDAKVTSINKTRRVIAEQNIVFVGSESVAITDVIKLMSKSGKLIELMTPEAISQTQKSLQKESINYTELKLDSGENIHLIEVRNLFQMDLVNQYWVKKCLGIILLLDLSKDNAIEALEATLSEYAFHFKDLSISVGVLNNDNTTKLNLNSVNKHLNKLKYHFAVFDVDPNNYSEISLLVQSMLISNLYGAQSNV